VEAVVPKSKVGMGHENERYLYFGKGWGRKGESKYWESSNFGGIRFSVFLISKNFLHKIY
jgi:hypothetical protein